MRNPILSQVRKKRRSLRGWFIRSSLTSQHRQGSVGPLRDGSRFGQHEVGLVHGFLTLGEARQNPIERGMANRLVIHYESVVG